MADWRNVLTPMKLIRVIPSGMFNRFPALQIISGPPGRDRNLFAINTG
jgi:hypothetical protein